MIKAPREGFQEPRYPYRVPLNLCILSSSLLRPNPEASVHLPIASSSVTADPGNHLRGNFRGFAFGLRVSLKLVAAIAMARVIVIVVVLVLIIIIPKP